jgi:hypothetical protein
MNKIIITMITLGLVSILTLGCSGKGPLPSPSSSAKPQAASQAGLTPSQTPPVSSQNFQQNVIPPASSPTLAGNPDMSATIIQQGITLIITQPLDGASINGDSVTVTGQTVPGATVAVNDQTGLADIKGDFSVRISLEDGLNPIDIVAVDGNGNQGEVLFLVTADLSQQMLSQLSVNNLENDLPLKVSTPADGAVLALGNITVKGQTVPEAIVCINDQVDTADANGNFNIAISLEAGPAVIDILATDDNGNQNEIILMVNVGSGNK